MSTEDRAAAGPAAVSIRTLVSRTIDGVRVVVDAERSSAQVDLGAAKSYDLVGLLPQIAVSIVGVREIDVIADNDYAAAFVRDELPRFLRIARDWAVSGPDYLPGAPW